MVAQPVKHYLEHEGPLLCSQEPATGTHINPNESVYAFVLYFIKIHAVKGLNRT
jgi:hypothetical protein